MLAYMLYKDVLLEILEEKEKTLFDFFGKILVIINVIFIMLISLILDLAILPLEIIIGIIYYIKIQKKEDKQWQRNKKKQ